MSPLQPNRRSLTAIATLSAALVLGGTSAASVATTHTG